MTTSTHLTFRDQARARLLAGTSSLAAAVAPTLGPQSRSVLIEKKFGSPIVCDDGVTIAKRIVLKDPEENLGAQMLRDAAVQTGDAVGDGTTTATLLANALFAEGLRNVVAGSSAVGIRRGMSRAADAAVAALRELSRPVKDTADTAQVATVSAHDDPDVGEMVASAIEAVGSDGVVDVEQARGVETELEVVEGFQFDKGYLSAYFATDAQSMDVALEDPAILIFEKKISNVNSIVPLLEQVLQAGRPLMIIAENVEGEALAALVLNKLRGTLQAVAVKAPGFGERRKETLKDIAILTGAHLVSEETGDKLEDVKLEQLGSARRVVVDKDTTTIIDGAGDSAVVGGRQVSIRRQISDTTSDWDREKLEERLAKLTGKVAVIRVGATTEAALERLKEAYDDAINATRAALDEGIVPGGGVALLRVRDAVETVVESLDGDERIGALVVHHALEVPARQLAVNSGADPGVTVHRIEHSEGFTGFDARNGSFVDLDAAGIIDPTKVVRTALETAVAVASTLLLAEVIMTDEEDDSAPPPGAAMPPEMY